MRASVYTTYLVFVVLKTSRSELFIAYTLNSVCRLVVTAERFIHRHCVACLVVQCNLLLWNLKFCLFVSATYPLGHLPLN